MKKWFPRVLLTLILIFAAFLRLYRIQDYMTFLGDEGRDVLVVYNILHGHLTLLGPTSSVGGFFLGPIYYYFMAPFLLLFNYNPVGPAVMVALFGILAVWFVYKIGSEFFNKATGLVAAFLFSISPIVIAYSRSSWNPNLMPIFTLFTLYAVYKGLQTSKNRYFVLAGILLGILMQLHYLSVFVAAIIVVYIGTIHFIFNKQKEASTLRKTLQTSAKQIGLGMLGFVIGWSPFLAFEVRHGFPNIISITKFIFSSPDVTATGNYFTIIHDVFFRLFARLATDFPPPEQVSLQANTHIAIWYGLTLALGMLSVIVFIWQFTKIWKEKNTKFLQYALIAIWFGLGVLLFGFYKKNIYDYYFAFLFPLPFLLIANFLVFLGKQKIYLKIVSIIIFVVLTYMNLQAMPFLSSPNRQLAQMREISSFVLSKTGNQPYNFALVTGGNSDFAYRYFFTVWGHPPVTIENTAVDPQRKTVTKQLLIVCETEPCAPLGNSLWEIAGFGRADIAGKWNVSVVTVYKLIHYKENATPKTTAAIQK
ncbi:MAG TPA: glycosyltransferase family 39 protein [Patescibacteria group bacterium]